MRSDLFHYILRTSPNGRDKKENKEIKQKVVHWLRNEIRAKFRSLCVGSNAIWKKEASALWSYWRVSPHQWHGSLDWCSRGGTVWVRRRKNTHCNLVCISPWPVAASIVASQLLARPLIAFVLAPHARWPLVHMFQTPGVGTPFLQPKYPSSNILN